MSLLDDVSIVVTPNGYKAGELYAVVPVPTEGSDEVNNGDFSNGTTGWNFTDSIGVVGTYFGRDEVCEVNFTNSSTIYAWQSSILTSDKIYKVTLDYYIPSTNTSVDNMVIKLGSTSSTSLSPELDILDTWTSVTLYGTADAGEFNIYRGSGTIGDKIYLDNVSVKEYTSADMDVTRATAGTRVDEDGLVNYAEVIGDEEITDGDFPTGTTNWTIEDVWTISGNSANGNGANGSSQQLVQSSVFTIGKTYKVTYDIINYVSGSVFMPNVGSSNSGDQTYSEYITATQSDFKITGINFYGSITNISVKEVTRDNVPRIDYTGGGCPHILAEPQRTNLVTYSSDFSNAAWTKSNSTIDSNATVSPDGTENASKLTVMVAAYSGIYETGDAAVNKYSMSVFAKKGDKDWLYFVDSNGTTLVAWFNLSNGTLGTITNGTATIEDFGNGWYRCIYSDTNNVSNVYFQMGLSDANNAYIPSSGGYAYIWGASKEVGSYETSYIPTSGSTVTRNQDIFTRDGIGSLINSTEGVLFLEYQSTEDSNLSLISISDGTDGDIVTIGRNANSTNIYAGVRSNSGNSLYYSSSAFANTSDFIKVAVKWKVNDFAVWVNGTEVSTSLSGNAPIGLSEINFYYGNALHTFYGKVKQLQVYNTALSDDQIKQLTQ